MKISALLSLGHAAAQVGRVLQPAHAVTVSPGPWQHRLAAVVERDAPDLVLIEDDRFDESAFAEIDAVNRQHPTIALVLLSSVQSPEFLMQAMRAGVREVLPATPADVDLASAAARAEAKRAAHRPRQPGKVLAFLPCKGGSGATFLAANLGWILAQRSTVLLVDLNLRFGDALSFVHDGEAPNTIADVTRNISRLDASLLASSCVRVAPRYSVLAAPHLPAEAMDISPSDVDAVLAVAIANYDFVVLDLDRSVDATSIKALDRCDRIYPVLQASVAGLRSAMKMTELFHGLGYPPSRIEAILNRCEKASEIDVDQVQRAMGATRVVTIPNAWQEASTSANRGVPVGRKPSASSLARALGSFAAALQPAIAQPGLLGRLFGRRA